MRRTVLQSLKANIGKLKDERTQHAAEPLPFGQKLKDFRNSLGISQKKFAETYDLAEGNIQNWEQGISKPDGVGMNLLNLIFVDPAGIAERIREANAIAAEDGRSPVSEIEVKGKARSRGGR